MKKLVLITTLLVFSCQEPKTISEDEALSAFHNLFEVLDNDLENFGSLVTNDFFIFENSKRYSLDEFIEFVKTFDIVSSKRTFEDIKIDTDHSSAHISLKQYGEFIINTPEGKAKLAFEWLESAYMVKVDDVLKFKFYFSEAINTKTSSVN